MLNLDFDRICRLCLAKDEELVSIFNETEEAEGVHNISYRIESCTCLKLGKCDGLPGALCTGCLSKLDHIKEFQDQCQRSDRVLREYLQTKEKEEHRNTKERKLRGRRGHGAKKGERGKVKKINADRVKSDYTLQESAEKLETGTDWNDCETAITSAIDSVKDEVNFEATDSCKDTSTHVTHSQQGPLLGNQTKTVDDEFVSNGKGVGGSNHNHENGLDSDDNEFSWPGRLSDEECDPTSEGPNKQLKGNCATASSKPRKRAGKKYECEYCGRTFPRSNHLAQHELTHTKEKPFQCSYCQKGFWYKNSLTGHIKQTHTGDVNFTCDECGRGFFQKSEFMRHKPIHSNETPFKCDECDMSFKLMKNLKRHQKVHTATRTHTCQYCGKSFRMLQTLRVHLILHSGEKPYKCSYCGRGFSQSAPLKAHVRMHTGERPYICNLCGESFPTGSSLKSHVFKHTGIHPYSCKDCSLVFKRKRDVIDHRNKVHGGAETAPMQVPPQLPPVVEHTYTQEPTSHLNNQQPLHLQNHQSNHLSSAQIHQTLSHIDNVTSDVLDTLSEDSLSSDLVSHHQILQNEVSQVLAMSSPSHLMSPSLVKSDSDELITSDLNFV